MSNPKRAPPQAFPPTPNPKAPIPDKTTAPPAEESSVQTPHDKPFKLGDLIEPFTPPPLAELDKTAEWIDNPVKSGMEMMRKKQEALGPPPVSVEEALEAPQRLAGEQREDSRHTEPPRAAR